MLILSILISVFMAMGQVYYVVDGMGPAVLACHFIFSVVMMFLLFRKVFVAMTLKFDQAVKKQDGATSSEKDKTSIIRLDNIDAFTRYALLMVIGLISTYLFLISATWSVSVRHPLKLGYSFVAVDLTVNATVLFLLFPIADKWYYGVCGKCHKCCRGCCIECVHRKMLMRSETDRNKQQFAELILSNPL